VARFDFFFIAAKTPRMLIKAVKTKTTC